MLKIIVNEKRFLHGLDSRVIPPNFEKMNCYFPRHISQSPIATSSKEAISLAEKFEGAGKGHGIAQQIHGVGTDLLVYQSLQETLIQLLEQI